MFDRDTVPLGRHDDADIAARERGSDETTHRMDEEVVALAELREVIPVAHVAPVEPGGKRRSSGSVGEHENGAYDSIEKRTHRRAWSLGPEKSADSEAHLDQPSSPIAPIGHCSTASRQRFSSSGVTG